MRYYLIAGETSGDLHGSNLMKHILFNDPSAEFRFWGGDLMASNGGTLVKHYKETAFMGITDILINISKILKNLKFCKADIEQYQPDALILIDYPGFNMRIASFAKAKGIKVHYYISPKVWAWNTKRTFKIKSDVDYLYSILPFEIDFFKPFGIIPDYIGNPLCDAISEYPFNPSFTKDNNIQKPIIALLPGSRMSELKHVLPIMLSIVNSYPEYEFIIAGANHISENEYQQYIGNMPVKLIRGKTYDVLKNSHAALVCSGTATLETALLNCPQVVCYKFSKISFAIGKMVIKVKYISLVNLIMNRVVVKELIQDELNTQNIQKELNKIISGKMRNKQLEDFIQLSEKVGKPGASERAAKLIVERCSLK
ncbi:MAG: lipid-A-disaccharide synthase [Bacteroidota bacterium]|nr:lipid-A-disaccharide synthase [Bacteroidota bacterium]